MQECNADSRYNFLHIDRHNDLGTNTPFDVYRHIKHNQHLSIDEPTLKIKACLKCLYFTIIIFDLCRYLEYFSYLYTIN